MKPAGEMPVRLEIIRKTDKKIGMPVAIRTRDLLLRRQTLLLLEKCIFIENVAEMWHLLFDIHVLCDTLRQNMKQGEFAV